MPTGSKRKFIIDTDGGIDDAQAMLMCLNASDVDVVAVTTVAGNTTLTEVVKNVLRLLKLAERTEIPVYEGSKKMLLGWEKPADYNYHGTDGFGDVFHEEPSGNVQPEHAVQTLLDLTKKYPGEITLVALGPLTNIALAIRLDPEFGSRLKSCYIMGGNYRAEGNITICAEFNFYSDPESAFITLHNLGCPITICCWELCCQSSLSWETYDELRKPNTPKCLFLRKIEASAVASSKLQGTKTYIACDEVLAACVLDERVIRNCERVYATVELHGQLTRGQMVVAWTGKSQSPNVRLVKEIDKEIYIAMMRGLVQ